MVVDGSAICHRSSNIFKSRKNVSIESRIIAIEETSPKKKKPKIIMFLLNLLS